MQQLSTAYDPAFYEVFFNVSTGTKDNDISLKHTRHQMAAPQEIDELQREAETWTRENYQPANWEGYLIAPKWKFHKQTPRAVEYKTGISDGSVLMLIIQVIP